MHFWGICIRASLDTLKVSPLGFLTELFRVLRNRSTAILQQFLHDCQAFSAFEPNRKSHQWRADIVHTTHQSNYKNRLTFLSKP